jgi:hypothetical protein
MNSAGDPEAAFRTAMVPKHQETKSTVPWGRRNAGFAVKEYNCFGCDLPSHRNIFSPGFIVANVFWPRGESNENSRRGTSWFNGSCFGSLPEVKRLVRYSVLNSTADAQCP